MRTETEWNIDRTECRFLVYRAGELVDVSQWVMLRPNAFVRRMHPFTRALAVPLGILVLELVMLLLMNVFG